MRRYSPPYYSPPRRGYGGWERSPPTRGCGRHIEKNNGSLLVRNIPLDTRPAELRIPFERFGVVRDVYLPRDYYTGVPRGFAFVQFVNPYDAAEAHYQMNGRVFAGREISVVSAAESRKRPQEMCQKARLRGPSRYGERRRLYYGKSQSRSPHHPSRDRHPSRSYSPTLRHRGDHSISPSRRHPDYPKSPRSLSRDPTRDGNHHWSYPSHYDNVADQDPNANGYGRRSRLESPEAQAQQKSQPGRASRSPSTSKSRSPNL